jgi:hypothetical protein
MPEALGESSNFLSQACKESMAAFVWLARPNKNPE